MNIRKNLSINLTYLLTFNFSHYLITMIGPHQGKELELMLAGEKSLAVFHDQVFAPDPQISEDIIPEAAFAPYVQKGEITRYAEDVYFDIRQANIRYVCFTLRGQEWRAKFYLWYINGLASGSILPSPEHEKIIGALFDYSNDDINDFIKKISN